MSRARDAWGREGEEREREKERDIFRSRTFSIISLVHSSSCNTVNAGNTHFVTVIPSFITEVIKLLRSYNSVSHGDARESLRPARSPPRADVYR